MKKTNTIKYIFSALVILLGGGFLTPALANVSITPLSTFDTRVRGKGGAEITAYDPTTKRLFVMLSAAAKVQVVDIHNPAKPLSVGEMDVSEYGSEANSVATAKGFLAIAVGAKVRTNPGKVVLADVQTLKVLRVFAVGALPDSVTFSPDGRWLLVANEGEPSDNYSVDPEGSIGIIDLAAGPAQATVKTVGLTAFKKSELDPSIRIFGPNASVAQDLEPEYIAISPDSTTAWITLQENNALAIVDIASAQVSRLVGLGFKDFSLAQNALDASDKDGAIRIRPWPVRGMYQPDEIAVYRAANQTYLVTANEGDSREYAGFNEKVRVGEMKLDAKAFGSFGEDLQRKKNLGRLKVTNTLGDTDGDGDFDALYAFGARSFSIRDANGALIFDSGSEIEKVTAKILPNYFNADNENNDFDGRSDNKGPEPEGIAVGTAFGQTLAFITLERIGGIIIYDITNPKHPVFESYTNPRNFAVDPSKAGAGDIGPEGICFIGPAESPNGKPLLVVGNEVSGTASIYEVSKPRLEANMPTSVTN